MTEGVTFHTLSPKNAALLATADIFDDPVRPDQLARFVADEDHLLVFATVSDRAVGFASGSVLYHPDKGPTLFINEVGVNEDWRRRGVARWLCEMLISDGRERGCEGIWLATEEDNEAARGLYAALGARETDGIVVYDWDGAMDFP